MPAPAIVRMPGSPERYSVSLGGGTYMVNAEAGECNCKDFIFQHADDRSHCKHLRALFEYPDEQKRCPRCKGVGILRMQESYADNHIPLPCARCGGSGQRAQPAAMSDAELRKLFG